MILFLLLNKFKECGNVKSDGLHTFFKEALTLIKCFYKVQLKHISRLDTNEADALAQVQLKKLKLEAICILEECKDVTSLMEVCEFFNGGDFPKGLNPTQRKQLVVRASQYITVDKDLYHKGKDSVL